MDTADLRRSCFVIAPAEAPIAAFLEALRKRRIEPFFVSDFLASHRSAFVQITSALKSADFVIALLFSGHSLANVILEIGIAIGAARPLMVVADSNVQIPSALSGIEIRRADLENSYDLVQLIDQFLGARLRKLEFRSDTAQSVLPRLAHRGGSRPPRVRREKLREAISALRNAQETPERNPFKLESELRNALGDAGWMVVEATPEAKPYAPDLAVWIDEVQKEIGNPIAVEIKLSLDLDDLRNVVLQLTGSMETVGAPAGIVVYAGQELNLNQHVAQASPPIFAFSVLELARLLETETFSTALKKARRAAARMQ